MAQEKIKVTIKKDGTMEVAVEGVAGKKCIEQTKELEVYLGKVMDKEFTADYYKPEPIGPEPWIKRR